MAFNKESGVYFLANDEKTYKQIVTSAYLSPWGFCFPNGLNKSNQFSEMKKQIHGNAKLLLHLFYNNITGKYEMQGTTATIEKSYPQIKTVNVLDWNNPAYNYDFFCGVFGEIGKVA